jgi:hypothetical protein
MHVVSLHNQNHCHSVYTRNHIFNDTLLHLKSERITFSTFARRSISVIEIFLFVHLCVICLRASAQNLRESAMVVSVCAVNPCASSQKLAYANKPTMLPLARRATAVFPFLGLQIPCDWGHGASCILSQSWRHWDTGPSALST